MHQAAVPSREVQSLFMYVVCAGLLCCHSCNFYWLLRGPAYGRELKSYRVVQSSQITNVNADASREQVHFLPDISQFCTGSFLPLFFFFAFCKHDNAHLAWRILWVPTVFTWYQQHSGWPVFIVLLKACCTYSFCGTLWFFLRGKVGCTDVWRTPQCVLVKTTRLFLTVLITGLPFYYRMGRCTCIYVWMYCY